MDTEHALAYLRVIAPDGSERTVAITQSPFCIGRGPHNELILDDLPISRHHACLRLESDQVLLIDLDSENGTWVGTSRLDANQSHALDYHETFRIGPYQLQLEPVSNAPPVRHPDEENVVHLSSVAPGPAQVPASAGSTQPPVSPDLIESSPSGRVGVLLKTPNLTITPGNSTNVSLVVINHNPGTDRFRIAVSGIPDLWLSAPPSLVELPSNARQEVNLTIHPPRSPDSRAGRYRLLIRVASQNVLTEAVEVRAALTVAPYIAFSSSLNPPRTGVNEVAQVAVRNDGNAQEMFTLTWLDPENRYEFRPAEMQMTLGPGESAAAEFRAVPHWRRWFGGRRVDVYSVRIAPEGGPPQSHTGQIVNIGLLPAWAPAVFLLLALCSVGTGVAAFGLLGPTPTEMTTATWTVTPTIPVTGTSTGVDSDGDGLTDAEEARLGTDPHNPDTDRDGLTDLDEVRRGTSPTLSDSDGDTLLDGQEAFGCSDPRKADTDGDGLRDNVDPDPCRLPTVTIAPSPLPTNTPLSTSTPVPTNTPMPTNTPLPTSTPLPNDSPTPLPSPTNTPTPTPTATPTITPTLTQLVP